MFKRACSLDHFVAKIVNVIGFGWRKANLWRSHGLILAKMVTCETASFL